jgi:hypothetical protein
MKRNDEDVFMKICGDAIESGKSIALAVAIRRLRDEYKWPECEVRTIGRELIDRLVSRMEGQVDTIIDDLHRLVNLNRNKEMMREMIVAAFALAGAQESEGFETRRRAQRN